MDKVHGEIGTPGPPDLKAQLMTSGLGNDDASGPPSYKSLGHQIDDNTGGKNVGLKVLFCSNIPLTVDYEQVYLLMKSYGRVVRIRLSLDKSEGSYNCYVVFDNHLSASKAKEYYHEYTVNERTVKTRLFHIDNFKDEPHDFFPLNSSNIESIERKLAAPKWFVASYKNNQENIIKGAESI